MTNTTVCVLSLLSLCIDYHGLPVHVYYSIGGESLAVAQNAYAVKWFSGRELNMVFGLQLSFSRVVWCTCIMMPFSLFLYSVSIQKLIKKNIDCDFVGWLSDIAAK